MFEKFTEKAIEVVKASQISAIELNHEKIYPEHLLIGLSYLKNGMIGKFMSMYKISPELIKEALAEEFNVKHAQKPVEFVVFSDSLKEIFNKSFVIANKLGNSYIMPEHLFLALTEDKTTKIYSILKKLNFDVSKAKGILIKVLEKKRTKILHPESTPKESNDKYDYILSIFKDPNSSSLFERAVAKLSTSNYEILGTEQIMQSILEDENFELLQTLESFGLNPHSFAEKLNEISSRQAEYEDKQIIFTPNALKTMILAIEVAKELGSASVKPEHVILGLLKSKSGIAYNIFKELNIDDSQLEQTILKPIEKQMSEALIIFRLARHEARRIGKNIVGSEAILLGILLEGSNIASCVLNQLGVNIKDARAEIEKLVGSVENYSEKDISFSQRAKAILEDAWNLAKTENKTKIEAQHLLLAICKQPKSLAMKALSNLGVDILEIRQGIHNKNSKNDRSN